VSFTSFPGLIQVSAQGGDDTLTGAGVGVTITGPIWTPLELNGAAGVNTVTGGAGPDTLVFREETVSEGGDTLSGGGGIDTAQASTAGAAAVATITVDGVANDGSNCPGVNCNGDNIGLDIERVVGSFSSETITGNSGSQYLAGGIDGDDALFGAGGADELHANSGTAQGGAGNDVLVPESANCVLRGGKGRDTATFAAVNKSVVVTLDNVANDGPSGSTINVHSDIENVTGSPLSDTLIGSGAANTLDAGAGNDSLYGQGGRDTFLPGPGDDSVSGGGGTDRLSFAASATPIVLDAVAKAVSGDGSDTFSSIESYVGSSFADVMHGSASGERIAGGAGDDDIAGAGGDDTLVGGAGDDTIDGGPGTDTCSQNGGSGSIEHCE
jgi:Ca2+-binding RTX toxin-like protein